MSEEQKQISEALLGEFIAECEEITQRVSSNLLNIEKHQPSSETLDSLYRDMHTFKGSSQLLGFRELGELAHAMETSLEPIRKHGCKPSPALLQAFSRCLDLIDQIMKAIQTNQPYELGEHLQVAIPELIEASLGSFGKDYRLERETAPFTEDLNLKKPEPTERAPQIPEGADPMTLTKEQNPTNPSVEMPPETLSKQTSTGDGIQGDANNTIRVSVSLLDKLMALMSEMVLVRNQVLQYSNRKDDMEFLNLSQRLDLVTSELQGEVMKTRMQPIGNVLNKFQRVVRDMARDLTKKLDMALFGVETELDKTLLEAIKDPLTHIVRNSCDHGIESPEDRKKAGKPETGTISIRAFHEGGQVIIEISDDGKGLHRDKLLTKALEKGLITQDKVSHMSDREIMNLIFAPGFSTAAKVTNVSGRGVGMDVVKNNIEKIGGQAEVESVAGKGMTVRLKIPLTLAIVPAMIVRCGTNRYAIPQVKLVELVRVDSNDTANQIEFLEGKPMYRLRGDLLPLISLKEVLGLSREMDDGNTVTNIVVLKFERQMFGLIVEEIQDTADIVVKPLSQFLKSLSIYSGATVLGDGSVALILDVFGLAQLGNLVNEKKEIGIQLGSTDRMHGQIHAADAQEFLLFKTGAPAKYCIPLNLVQRLEEFKANSVEYSGEQRVVRYRDSILPLISLADFLGFNSDSKKKKELLSVIVVKKANRFYGVEVEDILDVAYVDAAIDDSMRDRVGILGNVVHNNEVIVIVDILEVVSIESARMARRSGGSADRTERPSADFDERRKKVKILFADDTAFFRKHVQTVLNRAGFSVTSVNDGMEALKRLESSSPGDFTIVLSDIEMPKMSGLDLARAIRKESRWNGLPLIALTTRYSEHHLAEGKQAGFNSYLEKMKPDELISEIDKIISHSGGTI